VPAPKPQRGYSQQPQHIGVLFIITQQVQPAFIMAIMQSHMAWIILQQFMSPLQQVMEMPSVVISHLHMPIIMLQVIMVRPFIIIVQLTMPPASILQRFCIMAAAISSLAMHIIFMPSLVFSIFIVQRGIIIMFIAPAALPIGMFMLAPMPGMPIMFFSIIVVPFILAPRDPLRLFVWFSDS
jgi:hypothetical protein